MLTQSEQLINILDMIMKPEIYEIKKSRNIMMSGALSVRQPATLHGAYSEHGT
jgi:hypothetical protein